MPEVGFGTGAARGLLSGVGEPPYVALMAASTTQCAKLYKYELNRENCLNLYNSLARNYDSVLGRTTTLNNINYREAAITKSLISCLVI